MTTIYDVIIVGAGPAGGQCARRLAALGRRVLVLERARSHDDNAFSSAATVTSIMDQYALPRTVLGCEWRSLRVESNNERAAWSHARPLGVVLDFAELRRFLCADAKNRGAQILLGHEYVGHQRSGRTGFEVTVRDRNSDKSVKFRARILVDATGPARTVMKNAGATPGPLVRGAGIEMVIQTENPALVRDELVFLLGTKWAPRGYAWVFPMQTGRYKVGVCQYQLPSQNPHSVPETSLKTLLSEFLARLLPDRDFTSLETHGGVLQISLGPRNPFFTKGVIAVGDAVSALNPLGGEGIRHGMFSADVAAWAIQIGLRVNSGIPFLLYRWRMRLYFGLKWWISEMLMFKVYGNMSNSSLDRGVRLIGSLPIEKVMKVLFDYDFTAIFSVLLRR